MGSILIFFFIQNVALFSLIFWLLTWLMEFFFVKKNHYYKRQFYECGFKAISELNLQININFSILCIFLILYDIEFTFLFPLLFNFLNINLTILITFFFFFFFIVISLYYDLTHNVLNVTL